MVICMRRALSGGLRRSLRREHLPSRTRLPNNRDVMSLHARSIKAHMLRTHSRLTSNTPPRGNAHPAAGDDGRCRRWYLARLSRAGRRIYCTIGYSDGVSRWDLGVIQRAGFVRAFQDRLEKTTKTARTTVASGHKIWQYVGPLGSGDIPPVCLAGCFELLFPERRGIRCIRDKNMTCSTSCETSKSLLFKIAFHIPGELKVILSFSGHCAFLSERGLNTVTCLMFRRSASVLLVKFDPS